MISCLTFSKDRACQLELLLRSIQENFEEVEKVKIIYTYSNDEFKDGYDILMKEYPNHVWTKESSLILDIKRTVSEIDTPFSLVLVDDEVVINNHKVLPVDRLWDNPNFHCVSLRMHPKIDFTYTANIPSPPPSFTSKHGMLLWDWRTQNPNADWGYPSCINSHIYRTDFLKYWVDRIEFYSVNSLEGMLNLQRKFFPSWMACYSKAKTINIANNIVQLGPNRHSANQEFSLPNLNRSFINGYRISTENLYRLEVNMATFERNYLWQKPQKFQ